MQTGARTLDAAERAALQADGLAHSFVDLRDGTVHYQIAGPESGTPVLLVHGFALPSFVWDDHIGPLAEAGYRVVRFDNYGRGFSDRPRGPYDADLTDRLIVNLLGALGIDGPLHIVGYSMGGATAAIFAAGHPERVRSTTFIAPAGFGTRRSSALLSFVTLPGVGELTARLFGDRLAPRIVKVQAANAPDPAAFAAAFERQAAYPGYIEALLSTLRHYPLTSAQDYYRRAAGHGRPAMAIWGEADELVPFELAAALHDIVPSVTLHSFPGIGHDITYARPGLVRPLLTDFFARTDATAATGSTSRRARAS